MEKILFFLILLGFIFFYYSKPVLIEPQETIKQEEQAKAPKKKAPKVVKTETEQIIEVDQTPKERELPELSPIINSTAQHPYADPDKYPLHYAVCKGDLEQIKKVLKQENIINEQGEVILGTKECYCAENQYEICKCDATLIMPALNLALLKRDENTAKYLLRRNADPLIKDALGRNAFDIAQQQRMAQMQDYLAKYIK